MLAGAVRPEVLKVFLNLCRVKLSFTRGKSKHLVARSLDRARLVNVDVSRGSGNNALVLREQRVNNYLVGLCAADEKTNVDLVVLASGAYLFLCRGGVGIVAVARHRLHIGRNKIFKNFRVRTLYVIAFK